MSGTGNKNIKYLKSLVESDRQKSPVKVQIRAKNMTWLIIIQYGIF